MSHRLVKFYDVKKVILVSFTQSLIFLCCLPVYAQGQFGQKASNALPVFPGALGFGTLTVAGSGRHLSPPRTVVLKVTNLNDSGAGSLRACAEASHPRTCIFDLSGVIKLEAPIRIRAPYLTIAGQTAPEPGIMLRGAGIEIQSHDVLIQHLEIRPGDDLPGPNPVSRDGIAVTGTSSAYNVVVDHLSISWAVDENVSTGQKETRDVTFSNLIISEALRNSIHPKGVHSMGMLLGDGSKNISVHGCLFAHNMERNPRLKPGVHAEFINNVVYAWGGKSGWNLANVSDSDKSGIGTLFAFSGNNYLPGPESPLEPAIFGKPIAPNTRVYVGNNLGPSRDKTTDDAWAISGISESPHRSVEAPFALSGIQELGPEETYRHVLQHAGSRPKFRNDVDVRILNEVSTRSGSFKDCVQGCSESVGNWPQRAENRRDFQIPNSPFGDTDGDGYTNLEEILQKLSDALG